MNLDDWRERRWQHKHRRCQRLLSMRPEYARDYIAMHPDELWKLHPECQERVLAGIRRWTGEERRESQ